MLKHVQFGRTGFTGHGREQTGNGQRYTTYLNPMGCLMVPYLFPHSK
uniref:Uncharacterized protein n=1 Tax=Arabidopsis thaliana TaxID=3702 RepID=Q56WR1_ARATH|nr:hypothetical protein [Arabidopsis thaliana]